MIAFFLWLDELFELYIPTTQLVVAQFAIASLTLSIVALVANFSDRYIYGYRLSEAVFQRPKLDRLFFFVPILLTFLNIVFLVMSASALLVLCDFCVAMWLVSVLVWKITRAVFDPDGTANDIEAVYYQKALKQLKRDKPIEPVCDQRLNELQELTNTYIADWDIRLFTNIAMETRVAETLLAREKHAYQNYYIEFSNFNDPLSHIAGYANEMFLRGKYIEGIQNITTIISELNYYGIVNISDYVLIQPVRRSCECAKYLQDEQTAENYQERVIALEKNMWVQRNLYLMTDYSGYRLFEGEGGFPVPDFPDYYLASYYDAVRQNGHLCTSEKQRLFEKLIISLCLHDLDDPLKRRTYSDAVKLKGMPDADYLSREYENAFLCMKGLAIMLLSAMGTGDDGTAECCKRVRLKRRYFDALWLLCLSGLVKYAMDGYRSDYVLRLHLSKDDTTKFLKAIPYEKLSKDLDALAELYEEMRACYIRSGDDDKVVAAFGYDPRLDLGRDAEGIINAIFEALLSEDEKAIERLGIDSAEKSGQAKAVLSDVLSNRPRK